MTWNYQILRHKEEDHPDWYGLHEVYKDDDGKIESYTVHPASVGDTPQEVMSDLKLMSLDAHSRPIHNADQHEWGEQARQPSSLQTALHLLLDSADDTGCSEDLIVVSAAAVAAIKRKLRGES